MVRNALTIPYTLSRITIGHRFSLVTIVVFLLVIATSSYLMIWHLYIPITGSCSLSRMESDDFFCEPNYLWIERKTAFAFQDKANMMKVQNKIFFASNWEPNFHCTHKMRIGQIGDGGKWVCDPLRLAKNDNCIVYSAGSNGDFSFEIELKKILPKCTIFTFDKDDFPCPKGVCIFHQAVLGNGSTGCSKTWNIITQELNHKNEIIDIFKIDIESHEYEFFFDMFNSNIPTRNFPRQVLVEMHPASVSGMHRFFELFRQNHYVIFNKEPNLEAGPAYFEYSFLRLHANFFDRG